MLFCKRNYFERGHPKLPNIKRIQIEGWHLTSKTFGEKYMFQMIAG